MKTIAWLIPNLIEGSGGHRTILQHADFLRQKGYRCILYVENNEFHTDSGLKNTVKQLFGYEFEEVYAGWTEIRPADMAFATIWYSAKVVRDLPFQCVRCYFVQDYEAKFNPMGDAYLMAENSYRYGLYPITIGRWLPAILKRDFGVVASHFDFCADTDIYRYLPNTPRENAICFIYQPEKPRRCADLGIEALGIVKHHMPDVKIYLYGSKTSGRIWFDHENLGLISLEACNQLYNRCSVGLCISTTNPSRIPFEMMAAGLPVVEVYRDNTLYDFPDSAMSLCEATPESLAKGLMRVLSEFSQRHSMGKAGADYMRQRPLEYGLEQFLKVVETLLRGETPTPCDFPPMYAQASIRAEPGSGWPTNAGPGQGVIPYYGRLAFLPPPLRKVARFAYRQTRRLFS